jgi:hypothetical protein
MSYKIGEEIGFNKEFEIESAFGGNKLQVKEGDKGYIDSRGNIHYTTGQARGKIHSLGKEIEVKGYDHSNIAKMLFKRLNNQFNLKEALDDYDISDKDLIDELEDILSDIL